MNTLSIPTLTPRNVGGRPRKFKEASRPITITLPDRVLHTLDALGPDRARAIVRAVDHLHPPERALHPSVEVVEVAKGTGVILVGPTARLRKIPKLRLLEVAPSRYLITLLGGLTPADLEVCLSDILHDERITNPQERDLIESLHQHLRHLRRGQKVTRAEMLFVSS